jgi:hypothetical protein
MCTASRVDVDYAVAAHAAPSPHPRRQEANSTYSNACPEVRPIAPEAIVGELVKQYLHCSTTISGIFRCW